MNEPEIKVGDMVESKYWDARGVVKDIAVCDVNGCDKTKLTLDEAGSGIRSYYHLENFKLV